MLFMRPGSVWLKMPGEYDKPTYRELSRNLGHDYRRVQTRNANRAFLQKYFMHLTKLQIVRESSSETQLST